MTLKEIAKQIEAAKAAPIAADGTSDYWHLLPRVLYKDLPRKLKAEADKITPDRVKNLIFEAYPLDAIANISTDQTAFNEKITEALRAAVYVIESTDTSSENAEPLSLIAADFLKAWEIVTDIKSTPKEVPAVIVKRLNDIDFPVDKINKDIWTLLEYNPDGQITFARYNVANKSSKEDIYINVSLDFNDLEFTHITRKLEPYDKRVYLAMATLFNHGYDVISVSQIYHTMGCTGTAGDNDKQKINDSITKLHGAHLFVDNQAEADTYSKLHFKYDGSLLPMERKTAYFNGQLTEGAIHLFREPPMVSFARERKQITTVPIKLLETPLNKTNQNLALEDYLLEQIAHMKRGSITNKMLYQTIYENTGIKDKKQKQRAPEKIKKILSYYQSCGHIKAFDMESDKKGVTIIF